MSGAAGAVCDCLKECATSRGSYRTRFSWAEVGTLVHLSEKQLKYGLCKGFGVGIRKVEQNWRGFLPTKRRDLRTKFWARPLGIWDKPEHPSPGQPLSDHRSRFSSRLGFAPLLHRLARGKEHRTASGFPLQKESRQRTY